MKKRILRATLCVFLLTATVWLIGGPAVSDTTWTEVQPGVFRSALAPYGYALVSGDAALLIDAPHDAALLKSKSVKRFDAVLLTHHHRDTCAAVEGILRAGVAVRAPKASAEWLKPEGVRKYWQESLPLRNSRTAYLVVPVGWDGIDCSLEDGQTIDWRGWKIQVVATPGHSKDHVAFLARRGKEQPLLAFCGDAVAAAGKLWSPYTTDWDHWTDAGLTPAAQSLERLAQLKPSVLLPAHGEPIAQDTVGVLKRTAAAVADVAFLKSFERFTKERLGNAPSYRFLAAEQAKSNASLPWSKVSPHLWITGNTYVLVSKDANAFLVGDPWGQLSADQIAKLKKDQKLGDLEVVWFSHAHYDHYDGIYYLPDREKFQVWTLDRVAGPLAEPFKLRAPFLDPRPVKFDRRFHDGDTASWREYSFRFHHFPGQTEYTMAVETNIDGKKCLFTADNFFHQDMFSGSGGWMGLNRSFPLPYAASAQKVLDIAPEWVLAEHGGPFEFNAEDFRRRVQWGKASALAADAICPSGNHRRDWDPSRVHIEPLVQKAKPGAELHGTLTAYNPLDRAEKLTVTLEGRGLTVDQTWKLEVGPGGTAKREVSWRVAEKVVARRQVLALRVESDGTLDGCDAFVVVDVEP